jgi:AAA domain
VGGGRDTRAGGLTDFAGQAKKGGKTTFWCHAIAAGARGEDHAGLHVKPTKYLYLTEQGNNFAGPLEGSNLDDHEEYVKVIQFKDVAGIKWKELMERAGKEAEQLRLDALIVDTFAVFSGLKGSEENESGPVGDRMRVLRLLAQKHNIAVCLIRHSRKDGKPRGSSAFEAEADICVLLYRPEGRHTPGVRKLEVISRYGGSGSATSSLGTGATSLLGLTIRSSLARLCDLSSAYCPQDQMPASRKKRFLVSGRAKMSRSAPAL